MFKIRLRRKIAFLFAFFGLLPLMITGFLTISQIRNSLRETTRNNLVSLADEVMSSVEKTVQNIYMDVELLADNSLIKSKEASEEEKLYEMQKIQDLYGIFEDTTLIDLEGKVITSTVYKYSGEWITKRWYQEARQGKTSISPVHIILSPYRIILSSATPVIDKKGEIIAVVAAQLNMEKVWEITDGVRVEEGFAFMVNKEGRFIAYPKREKMLSKVPYSQFIEKIFSASKGNITYTSENGKEMIGGFVSSSDPKLIEKGWKLIVTQPKSEAFALVNIFQRQVIMIFLGGLALLLVISYSLSWSIVKPVKRIMEATKAVAAGKLGTKIKIRTGDEIEELAGFFNLMTEDLRESRESLEKAKASLEIKVKERTRELEEAKTILEIKVQARTKELKDLAGSLEEQIQQRTKELQERVEELEKFHKLTVGRELKMMELKEKIEKLEKELEEYKGRK